MKKVFLVLGVLVCTSSAMALVFTEDFESYATSGAPNPTWTEPPSYGILPVTTTANHTPAGSKSLLVNNNYGTGKRGEQHTFGMTLVGTDTDPVSLDYWIRAKDGASRRRGDVIVMLSMGEVGTDFTLPAVTDAPLATAIPVLAYAKPFSDNVSLYVFDGKQWTRGTPSLDSTSGAWENVDMDVKSTTMSLSTSTYGNYYPSWARQYLGGFDRVSVLYEGRSPAGAYVYSVDDITVSGIPEPATLVLLGLSGLFLRRRRA
ncbi:MAG: PEP-CTERM sorting domain-containing protein [Planctomycetes bacterium]|nr:PEP-CTERM sorting domain-containing protein [Planctomycetota bacterium]